jgi:hypothetical protein
MEKSIQIAWKIVPLRHFYPLKVVPFIEVFLYLETGIEPNGNSLQMGLFHNFLRTHNKRIPMERDSEDTKENI